MPTDTEYGVHFTVHLATHYSTRDVAELGSLAHESGFDQVWVNDNLGYRHLFVALAAIAARAPVGVGTGIAVPYLRNPVDVAGAVASLSELADGQGVTVGLGRGSPHLVGGTVEAPRPYRMLRETAEILDGLLSGATVRLGDYGLVADYFNLQRDATVALSFEPDAPTDVVVGGIGRTAMTVAGTFMDGTFTMALPFHELGWLEERFAVADRAAAEAGAAEPKHTVVLPVSVAETREAAYEFPRPYVAHMITGSTRTLLADEEFSAIGIDPADVEALAEVLRGGASIEEARHHVTDAMVEGLFVVGTPEGCAERLRAIVDDLRRLDVHQVAFGHLGPDYRRTMAFLASEFSLG